MLKVQLMEKKSKTTKADKNNSAIWFKTAHRDSPWSKQRLNQPRKIIVGSLRLWIRKQGMRWCSTNHLTKSKISCQNWNHLLNHTKLTNSTKPWPPWEQLIISKCWNLLLQGRAKGNRGMLLLKVLWGIVVSQK